MPGPVRWPLIFRVDYGHEEGARKFGRDPRVYSISSKAFLAGGDGSLAGIRTVDVERRDGRFVEAPGTEREWKADLVLLSMGFLGPESEPTLNQIAGLLPERPPRVREFVEVRSRRLARGVGGDPRAVRVPTGRPRLRRRRCPRPDSGGLVGFRDRPPNSDIGRRCKTEPFVDIQP